MDKYCGNSYNANRSSSSSGRSCSNNCSSNSYSANNSRSRNNGSEYAGRSSNSCCEAEYASRSSERSNGCGDSCYESCPSVLHLHEVLGSVQVAETGCEAHNHRFATVTSEPIVLKNGRHAHRLTFRTDTYDGHCHEFCGMTTDNFEICDGHVHYLEGRTSESDGHCHEFKVITHIENPTED